MKYFFIDKLESFKIDAVCARPDTPPKDNSCIAYTYFCCNVIECSDNSEIPLVISKLLNKNCKKALELSNLIFNNKIDQLYFMHQYLNTSLQQLNK